MGISADENKKACLTISSFDDHRNINISTISGEEAVICEPWMRVSANMEEFGTIPKENLRVHSRARRSQIVFTRGNPAMMFPVDVVETFWVRMSLNVVEHDLRG